MMYLSFTDLQQIPVLSTAIVWPCICVSQIGLIVYLAHVGSFVPAEAAKIGLMDGIFTRIQMRESVSLSLLWLFLETN